MGVLDFLKIPRGDRTDWAAKEHQLIDYTSNHQTEIVNAREGRASVLTNLNEKYASKTYVQLAILSPNPNDIVVSDIGISSLDVGKIGYSLQINNAGTGMLFNNTYRLANGSLYDPALYFDTNTNAGIYCDYTSVLESINFKLDGNSQANFTVDKNTEEVTLNVGVAAIKSTGVATLTNVNLTGDITAITANVTDVEAIGTNSSFAGLYAADLNAGTLDVTGLTKLYGLERNLSTSMLENFNISYLKNNTQDYFCVACFATPQDAGFNTNGYLQVIVGVGTETGKVIHIFYGTNRKISINYFNGTAWEGWKTLLDNTSLSGKANVAGDENQRFQVSAGVYNKDAVNLEQMNAAIAAAGGGGGGGSSSTTFFKYDTLNPLVNSTSGTGSFILAPGRSALIMLKGGGGAGGDSSLSGKTAITPTYPLTELKLASTTIAIADSGSNGMSSIVASTGANISMQDFNYAGQGLLGRSAVGSVYFRYIESSRPGYVGPGFRSNGPIGRIPSHSPYGVSYLLAGYGGRGGTDSGTIGQPGGPGGWILFEAYNSDTLISYTLDYIVGEGRTFDLLMPAPLGGEPGGPGNVWVCLNEL